MKTLGLWAFVTLTWLLGSIFSRWNLALIGEIIAGALLGPGLGDIVPFPEAWTLAGELALCFLVFDGALSLDLLKLRLVGFRALSIAVTGVVLPVAFSFGVMQAFGFPLLTSLACGVALASTAIGSTTVLLKSHNLHETEMGWMIASAAILDDVLSLVLLAIVSRLGVKSVAGGAGSLFFPGTNNTGLLAISPIIASIIVALIAFTLSFTLFPLVYLRISATEDACLAADLPPVAGPDLSEKSVEMVSSAALQHISISAASTAPTAENGVRQCDWLLYLFALSCTTALAVLADFLGTSVLFGIFMSASCLSSSMRPIEVSTTNQQEQATTVDIADISPGIHSRPANINDIHAQFTHVLSPICARLFFGSIGLTVPTRVLFRPGAILIGLCLTLVGALGKWLTGIVYEREWSRIHLVGFSMVSRGDLGFLLARTAKEQELLDDISYAAVVWALLLCTCLGPLVVSRILQRLKQQ
jgi:Kef-type K+ transport system membrane component KefB